LSEASRALKLWLSRIGWLVLIWALSAGALGLAALILRTIMSAAGLRG